MVGIQGTAQVVVCWVVESLEVRKFSMDYAIMLEWFDRAGFEADIAVTSAESGIRPTPLATWAATVNWAPAVAAR